MKYLNVYVHTYTNMKQRSININYVSDPYQKPVGKYFYLMEMETGLCNRTLLFIGV